MMLAVLAVPSTSHGIDELRQWFFPNSTGLKSAVTIGEAIAAWGQEEPHFATFGTQTLLFDGLYVRDFFGQLSTPAFLQSLECSSASLFLMLDGAHGQCKHFDFARIVERRVIRRWFGETDTNECNSIGEILPEELRVLDRLEARFNKSELRHFWQEYPQKIPVMQYPDADDDYEMDAFLEEYYDRCDSVPVPPRSAEGKATLTRLVRPLLLGLLSECLDVDVGSADFLFASAHPLDGTRMC